MAISTNFAYEASAGSGKTFALVIRYISLLYLNAKPETILALTFTNKAANEMGVRISVVLKELHLDSRCAELSELSRVLNMPSSDILAKREKILDSFLSSDIKISTIDKFLSQILRKFSLHLGLMPDFTIESQTSQHLFIKRFMSNIQKANLYSKLIDFSFYEQKKLSEIFGFLDNLYEKDGELDSLISYENIAYDLLENQIMVSIQDLQDIFFAHDKFSARGRKTLMVASIDDLLTKAWICKESLEYWDYKKYFIPKADELLKKIKYLLKKYFQAKELYVKSVYFDLYRVYKETKRYENSVSNELTFNDVTNLVNQLLSHEIDREFLYFRLDAKIDHLLIDEFQDTNILQYQIFEPIIDEISSGEGAGGLKSFFYVGDIKQSIYRFRGGAKGLFYHVADKYSVEIEPLSTNYRSKFQIVDFVNGLFRDKIRGYKDQLSCDQSKEGYVKVVEDEELLESVSTNILNLLDQGISPNDIAVLTFDNSSAFEIEEALLQKRASLEITTETTIKLINNREVSIVVELLKYLYFKDELYKINFLSMVGKDWDSEVDLGQFKVHEPLPKLIFKIISHFALYNRDENLLKLIELSATYKDIEAFLFDLEHIDVDAPSKKSRGIRILTIHKSKGLEFDHVVIADRFKKKPNHSSRIVFDYDNVTLQNLFVNFKNRKCVDEDYQLALSKEEQLSLEDHLNVQYVAFTRAKESLIICQKPKDSAFTNLALCSCEYGKLEPKQSKKEIITLSEPSFDYASLNIGLQDIKKSKNHDQLDHIDSINFGLAIHYMLEILEDFTYDSIEEAYWGMRNRYGSLLEDKICQEIKRRIIMLLNDKFFGSLISDGQISKEQPISYSSELKIIDLMIEKESEVVIIDYKSSHDLRGEYIAQVRHYKKAISAIMKKDTKGYLCFLRESGIFWERI